MIYIAFIKPKNVIINGFSEKYLKERPLAISSSTKIVLSIIHQNYTAIRKTQAALAVHYTFINKVARETILYKAGGEKRKTADIRRYRKRLIPYPATYARFTAAKSARYIRAVKVALVDLILLLPTTLLVVVLSLRARARWLKCTLLFTA